jgi:signal transduction histidine kinase
MSFSNEISRALAHQAGLAIQLSRHASGAKQAAILGERNRMAGEIHDSLAQSFVGISMHLDVAEVATSKAKGLHHIHRANELAQFGLAEARRSVLSCLHMTEGYVIGETDFECWDRLWKASPSDPEVDGEDWVTFSRRYV